MRARSAMQGFGVPLPGRQNVAGSGPGTREICGEGLAGSQTIVLVIYSCAILVIYVLYFSLSAVYYTTCVAIELLFISPCCHVMYIYINIYAYKFLKIHIYIYISFSMTLFQSI